MVIAGACERGTTRKTVEHGLFGCSHTLQRSDHFVVRVTVMDLQCEAVCFRDFDVGLKGLILRVSPLVTRAKKIEARLTHGTHARKRGKTCNF